MRNIKNIIKKHLLFEVEIPKNYEREFNNVYPTWLETYPNMQIDDAKEIYMVWRKCLNNGIITEKNEVTSQFLKKFDGQLNRKKIELRELQNINLIDIKHLLIYLSELQKYTKKIDTSDEDIAKKSQEKELELTKIFSKDGALTNDSKIETSKALWYDESTAKIVSGPLRVYEIMNQEDAIRFGYYYQYITTISATKNEQSGLYNIHDRKRMPGFRPWCITQRGQDVKMYRLDENGKKFGESIGTHYGNLYGTYRNENKYYGYTFYFIIDDSKPTDHRYHISSLGVKKDGEYRFTGQYNDGDVIADWNEIVSVYPLLSEFKDKISFRDYDTKDINKTVLDIVNEREGDENEFARQTREVQLQYVELGGYLTKPKSWVMAHPDVRRNYITSTQADSVEPRFKNMEFLQEVIKKDKNALNYRLTILGYEDGIKTLVEKYLFTKEGYVVARKNIVNDKICLIKIQKTKTYGLYDFDKLLFYIADNGTEYLNMKLLPKNEIRHSTAKKSYMINFYSKTNQIDDSCMIGMYHIEEMSNPNADAYFFTMKKWKELTDAGLLTVDPETKKKMINKPDIETDIDIKEITSKGRNRF